MEPYRDPSRPVTERVDDLLGRMSLPEKVGQLNQRLLGWRTWERNGSSFRLTDALDIELQQTGGVGAVYGLLRADAWSGQRWSNGADPQASAELTAMVQEKIISASPLGIPALFAEEAPHGHQALGGQLLPTNIGVAATWRPQLLEEAAAHVAAELQARGTHLALVSGLDILRDPRWGRAEECFGEDPLLASVFTRSLVRGLQSVRGVGAVLKHFAGQGAGIGGRNGSGAPIGPRELAEIHLPAARAGVEEGAVAVMAAYNDIDGIPCIANRALLTDLLRDDWGFTGLVMADMGAIDRLNQNTDDHAHTAALALQAGVDLSLCDLAFTKIISGVDCGIIDPAWVDRACARVLRVKIELGLLDPPQPPPAFPPPAEVDPLIADTAVLISNDGLLPLPADPGRVAVIGPNADDLDALLGDYVPPQPAGSGTTMAAGLRDRLGPDKIIVEPGSALTEAIDGGLERATAAARDADLVLLVLGSSGERSYADDFADNGAAELTGGQVRATTGEGFDIADVSLPAAQRELVDAVADTGTPTVAVIISGRPLGLDHLHGRCHAVLLGWYPGPEGGRVITELIFGDREPAGRLPVSLPRSSATLPVAYNERLENARRYVDAELGASHRFGHGLGYTDWHLGEPTLIEPTEPTEPTADHRLPAVRVPISNTGDRSGRQVVQLYGRARVPGLMPRRAVLLGFTAVELAAGDHRQVIVEVRSDALAGLGLPVGGGTVDLWPSIDGPSLTTDPVRVRIGTPESASASLPAG